MKRNYYFYSVEEPYYVVIDDEHDDYVMLVDSLGIVMVDSLLTAMKFENEEDAWNLASYLHEMTCGVWFVVGIVEKGK